METLSRPATANNYFSNDFNWEDLRDEIERLQGSEAPLSPAAEEFKEDSTVDAWNRFHNLHAKHAFFKERRYLVKEFPDLLASERTLKVLEIGCGTGSSIIPVLRANDKAIAYACDCSEFALKRAQDLVQEAISSHEKCRFFPFRCDIASENLPEWLHCSLCTRLGDVTEKQGESVLLNEPECCLSGLQNESFLIGDESPSQRIGRPSCCAGGVDIVMLVCHEKD